MKFIILIIIFITLNSSYGFTFNNNVEANFAQNLVKINVNSNGCDNLDYDHDQILSLVEKAMNRFWNTVSLSRLTITKGKLVSLDAAFNDEKLCSSEVDGNCIPNENLLVSDGITISCNSNVDVFPDQAILGKTLTNNIENLTIKGAIFLINDRADTLVNTLSEDNFIAFLAHEIGHAIGLGHSPVKDSLMYYQTVYERNSLGWDDIDAMTYLYPAGQPISCATILNSSKNDKQTFILSLLFTILILNFSKKTYLKLKPSF